MQDFEKLGVFYLGRQYDPAARALKDDLLLYESRDLVTHAVCAGMTGSGKTGLCLSILEEAAMDGIPALIIDPKGDLGNLLLTFPELKPEQFRPWINEDDARRKNLDPDEYARQQAELWRDGLAQWGESGERIANLRRNCDFSIYTPGSDAGLPVSILRSFEAPPREVIDDREMFRELVSATATALLGLLGIDADPIQSREHILLSNLFDNAWRNGANLDIAGLIHQVQNPPLTKIGVLDIEGFYPAKERFALAMAMNNLLASPGFEVWLQGEPLDIQSLLFTARGKPRMSIFSIAHLSDAERMFFVSLLLNQTLTWMRRQTGTTSLRALLYMDEIFGYFPPVGEPPSKRPLLTLLKQARAFGVGVVLATQNPVDLDYKGLSNAGTWFIGRLQTERDKNRVLDGLESVAGSGGGFDRAEMDRMLSSLSNRVFLMNDVHRGGPVVFQTRWAMSYLRGPLTRAQIKLLMEGDKAAAPAGAPKTGAASVMGVTSGARPVLPPEIPQYFVPARSASPLYQPRLFGSAEVKFLDARRNVDLTRSVNILAPITADATPVSWEDAAETDTTADELENAPADGATFADLPAAAAKAKSYALWNKEFLNWLFSNQKLDLYLSPSTSEMSNQEESERDFRARLQILARERRDADMEAIRDRYAPRMAALEEKIRRAHQKLDKEKTESQSAVLEGVVSVGAGLFGALFGSRKLSTAAGKAATAVRGIDRARRQSGDVTYAEENIATLQAQKEELEASIKAETDAIAAVNPATEKFEIVTIRPKKTGIAVRLTALAWVADE